MSLSADSSMIWTRTIGRPRSPGENLSHVARASEPGRRTRFPGRRPYPGLPLDAWDGIRGRALSVDRFGYSTPGAVAFEQTLDPR